MDVRSDYWEPYVLLVSVKFDYLSKADLLKRPESKTIHRTANEREISLVY